MPYMLEVHGVLETNAFLAAAEDAGMSEEERDELVSFVACNPTVGALLTGTGGCRKFRYKKRGMGKSGGYRTVTYYAGVDVPIFMLTVFGKGEKANLTQAERNALAKLTATLKTDYRKKK